MLDDEDIRKIVQAVRAIINAEQSVSGTLMDRWSGGRVIIKPGKADTQEKEFPVENLFRKIIAVRDRLRVLEQHINGHPKLSLEDKLQLQEYITRAYGSLTTFNFLFAEGEDHFVGARPKDGN